MEPILNRNSYELNDTLPGFCSEAEFKASVVETLLFDSSDYDMLLQTPYFFVGGCDYTGDLNRFCLRARLADQCIHVLKKDGVLEKSFMAETVAQRLYVRNILDQIYEPMIQYVQNVVSKTREYNTSRLRRHNQEPLDMVWLSLHLYLFESQMTRENVEKYIGQCVQGRRPLTSQESRRYEHQYYSKRIPMRYVPQYPFISPNMV
jgi:hypothetical protein